MLCNNSPGKPVYCAQLECPFFFFPEPENTYLLENISASFSFHIEILLKTSLWILEHRGEGGINHTYYAFYETTMRSDAMKFFR